MMYVHLLLRKEKARRPVLIEATGKSNDEDKGEMEPDLSLVELARLPCDSERCLVSASTSSRLTLSREYGVVTAPRISTNLEPGIVAEERGWEGGVEGAGTIEWWWW
jgi:hypothetical protein